MDEILLEKLINKYLSGTATPEEERSLEAWYENTISGNIIIPFGSKEEKEEWIMHMRKRLERYLSENSRTKRKNKVLLYASIAASVIILIGLGYMLYPFFASSKKLNKTAIIKNQDISPGHNGAILTLADGTKYVLDSANNGVITKDAGASISKNDSQIVYNDLGSLPAAVTYNTLIVPKGRQFKIILPDGTGVWLNSASSLKYPTAFTNKERAVTLEGEGYFEVTHNALRPFIVTVNGVKVRVLGTHFNINAYGDNGMIKTTLLQGSVSVTKGNRNTLIAPGEQADISISQDNIIVKTVNTADAVAWTQGFLSLNDNDIKEFMANLSRWYDLDIEYKGKIPVTNIGGLINRNTNLSDVLSALKDGGIHTKIEGRKIIISN